MDALHLFAKLCRQRFRFGSHLGIFGHRIRKFYLFEHRLAFFERSQFVLEAFLLLQCLLGSFEFIPESLGAYLEI